MKKFFSDQKFIGFVFVSISGTLLHFLYDISGGNLFFALFSGVNESTWEHMKLIFFPMLLFALIECKFFGCEDVFWCVKLCGIVSAISLIPILYYTYNGAFGNSPDWLNISFFYISAAAAFLLEAKLSERKSTCRFSQSISIFVLCCIGASFVIFTFTPPHLPLFEDPVTGLYGIM